MVTALALLRLGAAALDREYERDVAVRNLQAAERELVQARLAVQVAQREEPVACVRPVELAVKARRRS